MEAYFHDRMRQTINRKIRKEVLVKLRKRGSKNRSEYTPRQYVSLQRPLFESTFSEKAHFCARTSSVSTRYRSMRS